MAASVPQIVYSNSWLSQTGNISSTTMVTPSQIGMYRASVYTDVASTGTVDVSFGYTDDHGSQNTLYGGNGQSVGLSYVFEAVSGQPITVSFTIGGTPTFNAYVVLESLLP
mgnify:CR=1 FL=1